MSEEQATEEGRYDTVITMVILDWSLLEQSILGGIWVCRS